MGLERTNLPHTITPTYGQSVLTGKRGRLLPTLGSTGSRGAKQTASSGAIRLPDVDLRAPMVTLSMRKVLLDRLWARGRQQCALFMRNDVGAVGSAMQMARVASTSSLPFSRARRSWLPDPSDSRRRGCRDNPCS